MKFTGADIKDGKTRGEWAEIRFMARASEQGLRVSKPWGDSSSYDFIIEQIRGRRDVPPISCQVPRKYMIAVSH